MRPLMLAGPMERTARLGLFSSLGSKPAVSAARRSAQRPPHGEPESVTTRRRVAAGRRGMSGLEAVPKENGSFGGIVEVDVNGLFVLDFANDRRFGLAEGAIE